MSESFDRFAARKTLEAQAAVITPLRTTDAAADYAPTAGIGNGWTRAHFDGGFRVFDPSARLPAVSLVFVQSRDGNTGAKNPGDLGGGPVDLHLIYEGLSRVAADAVLAGATTANGHDVFFSVWHPALVALRAELGLPRHPTQIVVSRTRRLDADRTRLFNVPAVPVLVLAGSECRQHCRDLFSRRPWVRVVPFEADDWDHALAGVRAEHRISRISCVGGASTATSLIDAGVVQDLCLTTTSRDGGEPNTPFYAGQRDVRLTRLVRKDSWVGAADPIVFEHLKLE